MQETEKCVLCVLLQVLADKNLIPGDTCEKAKTEILDTLDGPDFFAEKREVNTDGYTQDPC